MLQPCLRLSQMRVVVHRSVSFLYKRVDIWQRSAARLGLQLVKHTDGMPMHDANVLLVGSTNSINPDELRSKLQLPSSCSILADSWMEASIAAGSPAPLQQHAVLAASAAAESAAAGAAGMKGPQLGSKRGLPNSADGAVGDDADSPAAKRRHTLPAEVAAGALIAVTHLPAAAAAAASAAGNAQTADALKTIIASRLWVPAEQQQQQRSQQGGQQQQMLQQQHAASGALKGQHQRQQQQHAGRLDVSWMSSTAIRVLSYNILADMYATGRSKSYCPAALRTWSSRWPRIAGELAAYQPHILCMQEVDHSRWVQDIQPWMAEHLNMQGLYWSRVYARNQGAREGITLLYNSSRFSLLHHSAVRFADHLPQAATPQQGAFWRRVGSFEEGALFALLRCSVTGRLLCCACTHLWYSPKDQDVKAGQTHVLCKCLVNFFKGCHQQGLLQQQQHADSAGQTRCSAGSEREAGGSFDEGAAGTAAGSGAAESAAAEGCMKEVAQAVRVPAEAVAVAPAAAAAAAGGGLLDLEQQQAGTGAQPVAQLTQQPQQQQGQRAQLAKLIAQLPTIVCGDFNSLWRLYSVEKGPDYKSTWPIPNCGYSVSGVYTLLSTGCLDSRQRHHPAQWRRFLSRTPTRHTSDHSRSASAASDSDEEKDDGGGGDAVQRQQQQHAELNSAGLSLRSAYLTARGAEPPLTNKHPGFAGCLDYVWCSPATLDVLGTLAMPYETLGYAQLSHSPYAVPFDSIPNGVWPSDHLAVGAVLQFKDE